MTTSTASDQVSLLSQTDGDDLSSARRVLGIEANALNSLAANLGENFILTIEVLSKIKGRVIISGMGNTSTMRSEAPLTTFGISVKPGVQFTKPPSLHTRLTRSRSPPHACAHMVRAISLVLAHS